MMLVAAVSADSRPNSIARAWPPPAGGEPQERVQGDGDGDGDGNGDGNGDGDGDGESDTRATYGAAIGFNGRISRCQYEETGVRFPDCHVHYTL